MTADHNEGDSRGEAFPCDAAALAKTHVDAPDADDATNLLPNPGFEELERGTRNQPAHWIERRWTRDDRLKVVTDWHAAHWGRRFLRLHAPGEGPIEIHPQAPVHAAPGTTYETCVWARSEDGAPVTLTVEPCHGKATLTPDWTAYCFSYVHPGNAQPAVGFRLGIQGGPAALDDVSLVAAGETWHVPREWTAERTKLAALAVDWTWRPPAAAVPWAVRVPVQLSEVMGRNAEDYAVALRLADVLPCFGYEFLSLDRIAIADGAAPGEPVRWTLVRSGSQRGFPGDDHLVFAASCPARSRKTYFVYFCDPAEKTGPGDRAGRVPAEFNTAERYPHRLYVDIEPPQREAKAHGRVSGGRLSAQVCDWRGRCVEARVVSPSGRSCTLPLQRADHDPYLWHTAKTPAGLLDEEGVWKFDADLHDDTGNRETHSVPFLYGSALWGAGNLKRINRSDPPFHVPNGALRIAAAQNEREAFQVVIGTTEGLRQVDLAVTDLEGDGGARISSANLRVERVEEIFVSKPELGSEAGWYADPILPWKRRDIPAHETRVAWITLSVPKDAPAGVYRGKVIAGESSGRELFLPLELTVFDFQLPDTPTFVPVLGADPIFALVDSPGNHGSGPIVTNPAGKGEPYGAFDREAIVELALHLGRNHCTPFYYFQHSSPYPSPWRYDPESKTAEIEFSHFDLHAEHLLRAGARYLFVGQLLPGQRDVHDVADWTDNKLRWARWTERPSTHRRRLDSEEGLEMIRAWGTAMGSHLKEKGWLDRTYVYIVDEAKTAEVCACVKNVARTLKDLSPPLKTFGASYVSTWQPYLEQMDAMSTSNGGLSDLFRKRWQAGRIENWGPYNRPIHPSYPLSIPRIIGPQSYFFGVNHYFQAAVWQSNHEWLNAHTGMWALNYPWPAGEPLPPGKRRAFASSVRMEAIRESVEDYEYLRMLAEIVQGEPKHSSRSRRARQLLDRIDKLIRDSVITPNRRWRGGEETHAIYQIDEEAYQALRRRAGHHIEESAAFR